MKKYDTVQIMHDIYNIAGIWIEYELDSNTGIFEQDGVRYLVSGDHKKVIDIYTGTEIFESDIINIDNINDDKYYWMLLQEL